MAVFIGAENIVYISLVKGSITMSVISWYPLGKPVILILLSVVAGGLQTDRLILEVIPPPATNICGFPLLQLHNNFQASRKASFASVMKLS